MWKAPRWGEVQFSKSYGLTCLVGGFALAYLLSGSGVGLLCSSESSFSERFFSKFPSLAGEAHVFKTPACNVFAVKHGDSYVFFDNDLTTSIQGNMDALQEGNLKPIRIFGTDESKRESNTRVRGTEVRSTPRSNLGKYESGYGANVVAQTASTEAEPKNVQTGDSGAPESPSPHIGVTNREVNADLKNLDFSILPVYKAEQSKGALLTFVDITCPACKRYVDNIQALNEQGIDVYLAPYPRAGGHSVVARKMLSNWCANYVNNQTNVSQILKTFKGASISEQACNDKQYELKFNQFIEFGEKHLNKTTPVSFTNNGITVVANHPADVFFSAFVYGNTMSQFLRSNSEVIKQ
ncbi:hypothetical protein GCM10011607_12280 [Shewanella inventionis]|uniref:Thioredoxin-like fold domain-containing protein n=1 Tax=Shewanella inventionis TaxID=1738770 RepID=A0ABQ1IVR7_9GAMM|nr:hypothetical protein [Shewanella inventionis]GGB53285.1 hypothetical protein GCM10011607_12280 [Shewanella inventionis]